MNGIDDLRRTLDQHASGLVDHDAPVRSSAIHSRVAVVRRRRRAVAAGGVAAVLATVAGVSLIPSGDQGPGPATTVVGLQPPAELTSLGFTYALADGVDGEDGVVRLRLEASDEPRLVSWATSGGDDRVTITASGEMPVTHTDADFGNWTYVAPGGATTLKATVADGDPGLAVYELTDVRPEGYSQDGVTFRQSIAGSDLLGAVVGDPGDNEVTVEATATGLGLDMRYFCVGGPRNAFLHVETGGDGELISGGGCRDLLPVDAGTSGGSSFPTTIGEDVTTRFYVTDGEDGPLVEDDDIQLVLGLYAFEDLGAISTLDGATPEEVEADGHTWRLVATDGAELSSTGFEATAPRGQGAILSVVTTFASDVTVEPVVDGESTGTQFVGRGGSSTQIVNEGARVGLDVVRGEPRGGDQVDIAFYVRAD